LSAHPLCGDSVLLEELLRVAVANREVETLLVLVRDPPRDGALSDRALALPQLPDIPPDDVERPTWCLDPDDADREPLASVHLV
jgi:hypothetical protein